MLEVNCVLGMIESLPSWIMVSEAAGRGFSEWLCQECTAISGSASTRGKSSVMHCEHFFRRVF